MKGLWGSSIAALLVGVSSGVFAADLRAPPAPVAPVYNWTGFYLGFNFGGAVPHGTLTNDLVVNNVFTSTSFSTNSDLGLVGGGQVGYNWQVSPNFVLGVEGMFDGARFDDNADLVLVGPPFNGTRAIAATANTNWIAMATGRIGITGGSLGNILGSTLTNNTLFYAKGGGAWVQTDASVTELQRVGSAATGVFVPEASFSASNTRSGWVAGAGIEYGVLPNFTVRVEYDHIGLGSLTRSGTVVVGPDVISDTLTLSRSIDMFSVVADYK